MGQYKNNLMLYSVIKDLQILISKHKNRIKKMKNMRKKMKKMREKFKLWKNNMKKKLKLWRKNLKYLQNLCKIKNEEISHLSN